MRSGVTSFAANQPIEGEERPLSWQINRSKANGHRFHRKSADRRRRATGFAANQPIQGEERPHSWQISRSKAKSHSFRGNRPIEGEERSISSQINQSKGEEPPFSSQINQSKATIDHSRRKSTDRRRRATMFVSSGLKSRSDDSSMRSIRPKQRGNHHWT
jgi:hypothetical protein